ncbi:hypothetical protein PTI98_013638 [Pleurotus ostreatus]|nr:hypothetical protein PTI98_013638 [Pleurotus ostreatus]
MDERRGAARGLQLLMSFRDLLSVLVHSTKDNAGKRDSSNTSEGYGVFGFKFNLRECCLYVQSVYDSVRGHQEKREKSVSKSPHRVRSPYHNEMNKSDYEGV